MTEERAPLVGRYLRRLTKVALRGVIVVVPITITVYVLFWVFSLMESAMQRLLSLILPEHLYFPGVGTLCMIGLILGAGVAIKEAHVDASFRTLERALLKVPFVKSIYSISKDFLEYVATDRERRSLGQVVSVQFEEADFQLIGFLTEKEPGRHSPSLEQKGTVAVYLPMGYQIGGYTILVDRRRVRALDISFEEAIRFILTAGVSQTVEPEEAVRGKSA